MLKNNEQVNEANVEVEVSVRPLGRSTARELSSDEIASIAGGFTHGISNAGGWCDKDYMN